MVAKFTRYERFLDWCSRCDWFPLLFSPIVAGSFIFIALTISHYWQAAGAREKSMGSLSYYEATLLLDAEVDRLEYLRDLSNRPSVAGDVREDLDRKFEEQAKRVERIAVARNEAATREGL